MSVQKECPDVCSQDFSEMREQVNTLVGNYFEGLSPDRDGAGGYVYREEGQRVFRFDLIGTVNSDPDILGQGYRAAAFQVFDEALDREIRKILEGVFEEVDCFESVEKTCYNGYKVYEAEFGL
ncbi:MAG: hypothetical protein ABEJ93_02890 [Candidatus Nanohalobium sp.]